MTGNQGQTVRRALGILKLFQGAKPLLTTRDVLVRTDLPKTTTLRLLSILRAEGLLYTAGDGYLGPGPALLALARSVQEHWHVAPATEDLVHQLAADAHETASIFVIDDLYRMCVCRAEGPQAVRYVVSVGDRLPLSSGASSFVLLSDKADDFLKRVMTVAPPGKDFGELSAQVAAARNAGFAVSHGTREPGLSAVAAPIVVEDRVVAALSVSGPTSRLSDPWLPNLVSLTQSAARQLSEATPADPFFMLQLGTEHG